MARINGVSSGQAGLYIKAAYYFTRRSTAKLTGRARALDEARQAAGGLDIRIGGGPFASRHVLVVPAAHAASVQSDSGLRRHPGDLDVVTGDVTQTLRPRDNGTGPVILVRPDGHVAAPGQARQTPGTAKITGLPHRNRPEQPPLTQGKVSIDVHTAAAGPATPVRRQPGRASSAWPTTLSTTSKYPPNSAPVLPGRRGRRWCRRSSRH